MTKKYIILAPTDRKTNLSIGDYTLPLYSYNRLAVEAWSWVIVFDSLDEAKHLLFPTEGIKSSMDEMDKWKMTCCVAECEVTGEGKEQQVQQVTKLHYIHWLRIQKDTSENKRSQSVKKADWQEVVVPGEKVSAEFLNLLTNQLHKMIKPVVELEDEDENDASLISSAASSVWWALSGVYLFVDAIAASRHVPMISPLMGVLRWWWHRQAEAAPALTLPEPQQKITAAPQRLFAGNPKRQTKENPQIKRDSITLTHF